MTAFSGGVILFSTRVVLRIYFQKKHECIPSNVCIPSLYSIDLEHSKASFLSHQPHHMKCRVAPEVVDLKFNGQKIRKPGVAFYSGWLKLQSLLAAS